MTALYHFTAKGLRALFRDKDVCRYVRVSEVWFLEHVKSDEIGDILGRGPIRNNPQRREAVFLEAADGNDFLIARREIVRPAHGKPYLTRLEIEQPGEIEGRFVGLLPATANVRHDH